MRVVRKKTSENYADQNGELCEMKGKREKKIILFVVYTEIYSREKWYFSGRFFAPANNRYV